MLKPIAILASLSVAALLAAPAFAEDDEGLVRLPGKGEPRDRILKDRLDADRLKPGAGLFVSFDTDTNGLISQSEVAAGIPVAFQSADANEDGFLTALEQQDWADSLPTRDGSLANPTRFDPNLDRRVSLEEFTAVIEGLGSDYADAETGDITLENLKAPKETKTRREREAEEFLERRAEAERERSRPATIRN